MSDNSNKWLWSGSNCCSDIRSANSSSQSIKRIIPLAIWVARKPLCVREQRQMAWELLKLWDVSLDTHINPNSDPLLVAHPPQIDTHSLIMFADRNSSSRLIIDSVWENGCTWRHGYLRPASKKTPKDFLRRPQADCNPLRSRFGWAPVSRTMCDVQRHIWDGQGGGHRSEMEPQELERNFDGCKINCRGNEATMW